MHPVQAGVEALRCDLSALERPEDVLAAVGSYAREHPDREWVLGGGWSMPAFGTAGPQAADLDALLGDRPVFLANRDHHSAWVSGEALRRAGLDASTPDPRRRPDRAGGRRQPERHVARGRDGPGPARGAPDDRG